jgi:hypothetical protein
MGALDHETGLGLPLLVFLVSTRSLHIPTQARRLAYEEEGPPNVVCAVATSANGTSWTKATDTNACGWNDLHSGIQRRESFICGRGHLHNIIQRHGIPKPLANNYKLHHRQSVLFFDNRKRNGSHMRRIYLWYATSIVCVAQQSTRIPDSMIHATVSAQLAQRRAGDKVNAELAKDKAWCEARGMVLQPAKDGIVFDCIVWQGQPMAPPNSTTNR